VRQSYDAVWVDDQKGPWRFITFYSQPVQTLNERIFDDYSSSAQTMSGIRVERDLSATILLASYVLRYTQEGAHYLTVSGNEERDVVDTRSAGTAGEVDWDVEGMVQTGRIGTYTIRAWALGSLGGYTFSDLEWTPRIGIQFDAASGNHDVTGHTLNTFNPLFPNGAYVSLSGYSGYANFIQVKPSLTLHPLTALKFIFAVAPQWRQSTADAIYTEPNLPVPDTAGRADKYTGTYEQFRLDWAYSRSTSFAIEAVHFGVGDVIRRAGGHASNYLGVEFSYGW
jgi:Alginate export